MINLKWVKRYCKDYTQIENYEEAVNDKSQLWVCHHILGEILTHEQLKEHDFYYNVPSCMLKFVTKSEHSILHNKGKHLSEYTKRKLSVVAKGSHRSEETKQKISEARKGISFSEEHCRNLSSIAKGRKMIIGVDGKRHWTK